MAHLGPHLYSEDNERSLVEPASEIFEIDDFTSPSDWEKFVSQVEHLIRDWGLSKRRRRKEKVSSKVPVKQKTGGLNFYGFQFLIELYDIHQSSLEENDDDEGEAESQEGKTPEALQELMCVGQKEFPPRLFAHPIHYYYGLNSFVILSPDTKVEKEDIDNETRAKVALSTLTVALHNTGCQVPFFVQVMDRHKKMFSGVFASERFRSSFEMIVLGKQPPYCDHLTGLLNMFKNKIKQNSFLNEIPSSKVTVRFTYLLDDWTCHAWTQPPPDLDMFMFGSVSQDFVQDLGQLPFGSVKEPVRQLRLHATWHDLQEDIITDNDVHSDLEVMEAPAWSVGVQFEENPQCLLNEYISQYMSMCEKQDTMRQLLGDIVKNDLDNNDENLDKIPDVFDRLTGGGSYDFSSMLKNPVDPGAFRSRNVQIGAPISETHLTTILEYLFPDSATSPEHPYPVDFTSISNASSPFALGMAGIKSCPVNGLVWRLTIVLSHCLHVLGGIKPVAHLLHEFMLEVRFRWENGQLLPGLPSGTPDHAFGLFHQKLQMINCCIEKKLARERRSFSISSDQQKEEEMEEEEEEEEKEHKDSEESDDEEFFDCDDDQQQAKEEDKSQVPIWSKDPVGRLKKMGKLKLLQHDAYLYVPICQDPTPMTEDMLAEQAEIMLQLGMDSQGAQLRAKMQSASLLSDMESFKAANPGSVLADFVRWHSPRDFEEDTRSLSPRMKVEGNIWQEAWESAKPVPARRQKRLFDDTKEAEKVLQYINSLKPSEVSQMLLPCLLHCGISRILTECGLETIPKVPEILRDCIQKLVSGARLRCCAELKHYKNLETDEDSDSLSAEIVKRNLMLVEVANLIQLAELKVSQAFSLKAKFLRNVHKIQEACAEQDKAQVKQQMGDFVQALCTQPQVSAIGASRGPVGRLVTQMFKEAGKAQQMIIDELTEEEEMKLDPFHRPESREFVLKACANRPYTYSQASPQRMYACLQNNEFRVAGAFTIDKQFM